MKGHEAFRMEKILAVIQLISVKFHLTSKVRAAKARLSVCGGHATLVGASGFKPAGWAGVCLSRSSILLPSRHLFSHPS